MTARSVPLINILWLARTSALTVVYGMKGLMPTSQAVWIIFQHFLPLLDQVVDPPLHQVMDPSLDQVLHLLSHPVSAKQEHTGM